MSANRYIPARHPALPDFSSPSHPALIFPDKIRQQLHSIPAPPPTNERQNDNMSGNFGTSPYDRKPNEQADDNMNGYNNWSPAFGRPRTIISSGQGEKPKSPELLVRRDSPTGSPAMLSPDTTVVSRAASRECTNPESEIGRVTLGTGETLESGAGLSRDRDEAWPHYSVYSRLSAAAAVSTPLQGLGGSRRFPSGSQTGPISFLAASPNAPAKGSNHTAGSVKAAKSAGSSATEASDAVIYQYDVEVYSAPPLSKALTKQICKDFRDQAFERQANSNTVKIDNKTLITSQPVPELEAAYLRISRSHPAAGPGLFKVSETDDKWMSLETAGTPVQLVELANVICDGAISQGTKTKLQSFVVSVHEALEEPEREARHAVIVVAKRKSVRIDGLLSLTGPERSRHEQAASAWAAGKAKKDDQLQINDRVFDAPTTMGECGVELRKGEVVKPGLRSDGATCAVRAECKKLFFQPLQLSDFMLRYFGESVLTCNAAKARELTAVLKGVQVRVASLRDEKKHTIQEVVYWTVDEVSVEGAGYSSAITLRERYEKVHGQRLRHDKYPCIDIGANGDHVYVAAEDCQLVKDQPFNHTLPVFGDAFPVYEGTADAEIEGGTGRMDAVAAKKTSAVSHDIASRLLPDKVDLSHCSVKLFEVVVIPPGRTRDDVDQLRLVNDRNWSRLESAVSKRFNGALDDVITKLLTILPYEVHAPNNANQAWEKILRRDVLDVPPELPNERKIVVVAVPAGAHNHDIYERLKEVCDVQLGIQCKIIRADTLIKTAAGPHDELKRFTGAIVRNLLARTLYPPKLESAPALTQHKAVNGLLYGVHVRSLQGIEVVGAAQIGTLNVARFRLVTITSAATWIAGIVRTTHHLVLADFNRHAGQDGSDGKAQYIQKLTACFQEHAENTTDRFNSVQPTHVVFYRSGGDHTETDLTIAAVQHLHPHIDEFRRALISFTPETTVALQPGSPPVQLYGRAGLDAAAHFDTHLADPFGMNTAFLRTYARDRKDGVLSRADLGRGNDTRVPTHCIRVCLPISAAEGPQDAHYGILKQAFVPGILDLAQRGSRYALRYVHVPKGKGGVVPGLELKGIQEGLRGMLYYI
ncbi:hypothetical protein LTR53_001133 [Teratosphaeriaceae sp. CCFEE 6253]|nr:hypothetical protein LTR53_001133 [Teratosphaeriaceae sp. CCFEE 6253]